MLRQMPYGTLGAPGVPSEISPSPDGAVEGWSRLMNSIWKATWILILGATTSIACSCPDLAWQGLMIDGERVDGTSTAFDSQVRLTVEELSTDGNVKRTVASNRDPFGSFAEIPAGRYRISGSVQGQNLEPLSNVCTLGDHTGCDAEAMSDTNQARVVIRQQADKTYVMSLDRNGPCP